MRKLYLNLCLFCISILLFTSCLDINETSFIDLKARFLPSSSLIQLGTEITFNQQSTLVADQFLWDFGDGTTSNERSPKYTYDSVGRYDVKLVSIKVDGITKDSVIQQVIVLPTTDSVSNYTTSGEALSEEIGFSFAKVPGNGYLFAGRKNLNAVLVIKTDDNLQEIWHKEFNNVANGRGQVFVKDVIPTVDGGFLVTGYFEYNVNESDAFLLKINADGDEIWTRYAKTQRDERFNRVLEINDFLLVVGTISEVSNTGNKIPSLMLAVYKNNGDLDDLLIEGSNWTANDFTFTYDGGFAFAVTEGDRPRIFRFDPNFAELQKYVPLLDNAPFEGKALGITQLNNGNLALVGEVNYTKELGASADSSNAFIAVFDDFGSQQWIDRRAYYNERYQDVIESSNGNIIAVGTHENPLTGKDILVGSYNPEGTEYQFKLVGGIQDDEGFTVRRDADGKFAVIGSTKSFGSGQRDFYFFRLNANLE